MIQPRTTWTWKTCKIERRVSRCRHVDHSSDPGPALRLAKRLHEIPLRDLSSAPSLISPGSVEVLAIEDGVRCSEYLVLPADISKSRTNDASNGFTTVPEPWQMPLSISQ